MIWIVMFAILGGIAFVFMSKAAAQTVRHQTGNVKAGERMLSADEQANLAAQTREMADAAYQRIFAAAKASGKDDAFAHQVGILQAIQKVSMPSRNPTNDEHKALQVEAAPFNKTELDVGQRAVKEYLVWKYFPDQADEAAFSDTLSVFRDEVYRIAKTEDRPDDFIFAMLFSMKYDWQRWLSEHRNGAGG